MISAFRPVDAAPEAIAMPSIAAGHVGGDQALDQVVTILSAHQQDP